MNWVRRMIWARYTVIAKVIFILQITQDFIPGLNTYTQVPFHTVSIGRWTVEAGKDTH